MSEWTFEKIDEAFNEREDFNESLFNESWLSVDNLAAELFDICDRSMAYEQFEPHALAYINSPWRKICRLGKIASGTKRTTDVPGGSVTLEAFNIEGTQRPISPDGMGWALTDTHDGWYHFQFGLKFTYSGAQDICTLHMKLDSIRIRENSGTPIPLFPSWQPRLAPDIYPGALQFPSDESNDILLRFSTPLPLSFEQTFNIYFYRPKGTFLIKKIVLEEDSESG